MNASATLDIEVLRRDSLHFPPPQRALREPNGLLAVGGDLRPERLEAAYRAGIFPWFQDDQPILWWSPDPRARIDLARLRVSRTLKRRLRRNEFRFTVDTDFGAVIRACAELRADRPGTWITQSMQVAYQRLADLGYSHSLEVWQHDRLVGGLYGVSFGGGFFGESMFSRASDASKAALAMLALNCDAWGIDLIDCQMPTPHLLSMGAEAIARDEFLRALALSNAQPTRRGRWQLAVETWPNDRGTV